MKWVGLLFAALAAVALAGPIKVWAPNEALKPEDLNANFAHLANNIISGDGGMNDIRNTAVNEDFATNASISTSKLRYPAHIPKAVQYVAGSCTTYCDAGNCLRAGYNVDKVCNSGTVGYTNFYLGFTPSDAGFAVFIEPFSSLNANYICAPSSISYAARDAGSPQVTVLCQQATLPFDGGAPTATNNAGYYLMVYDYANVAGVQ